MRRLRPLFALLVIAGIADSAHAFDKFEHTYVTNLALRFALRIAPPADLESVECWLSGAGARCQQSQAAKPTSASADCPVSMGEVVSLSDYIRDVQVLFDRPGMDGAYPASCSQIDWGHFRELQRDYLRFLQAAHTNENHFQRLALISHWNSHNQAVRLASEGKLNAALLVEAYGLHFLQDWYASGHIATNRSQLIDTVATASHDKYNRDGLYFFFKRRDGDSKVLDTMLAVADRVLAEENRPSPWNEGLSLEHFQKLSNVYKRNGSLMFEGDSRLDSNRVQAAFLVFATTVSLVDVMQSYSTRTPHSSFGSFRFHVPSIASTGERVGLSEVWLEAKERRKKERGSRPTMEEQRQAIAESIFGQFDTSDVARPLAHHNYLDVLMLNFHTEINGNRETESTRVTVAVESVVAAMVEPPDTRSLPYVSSLFDYMSLVWGVSYTFDEHYEGPGAHFRYVMPLQRLDSQLTLGIGTEYGKTRSGRHWNFPVNVGWEMGFGYLLLHVGGKLGYIPNADGTPDRELMFKSGVTIVIPGGVTRKVGRAITRIGG